MRYLLCKRSRNGWLLLALAAGACSLPAAAKQAPAQGKSSKISTSSSSSHSTKSSTTGKSAATSGKSSSKKKKSRRVKGQAAPTMERIGEIQEALTRSGAYKEAPSGKWDDSTVEAMKSFQSSHGLNPSGKLDAITLQKLGLGSETAGLAAPTPPPNGTANRLLSRSAQREELKDQDQPQ